jgi:hypothetical protein
MAVGTAIFSAIFVSSAVAGCGDLSSLQGPFQLVDPKIEAQAFVQRVANADFNERGGPPNTGITGMWQSRMISKGNTGHVPSIPDGALIDFGYHQWHSDGTEVVNSGGHSPASANWCMGVWSQTGFLTHEINHFPIAYNPTTGEIANYINFRAQIARRLGLQFRPAHQSRILRRRDPSKAPLPTEKANPIPDCRFSSHWGQASIAGRYSFLSRNRHESPNAYVVAAAVTQRWTVNVVAVTLPSAASTPWLSRPTEPCMSSYGG